MASIERVNLTGANLTRANLTHATQGRGIIGTPSALPPIFVLVNGYLLGPNASFGGSNNGVLLANLSGLNLPGVNLSGVEGAANFTGTNLSGANLGRAILPHSNFTGANLTGANVSYTFLQYSNFTNANLTGATTTGWNNGISPEDRGLLGVIWSNTTCPNGTVVTNPATC